MRRLKLFLGALVFVLGMSGAAWGLWIDEVDLENVSLSGEGVFTWNHALPEGFSVPPYTVHSAFLEITAIRAADGNDDVSWISGDVTTFLASLNGPTGNSNNNNLPANSYGTDIDLLDFEVFVSWVVGDVLQFSIDYVHEGYRLPMTLVSSVFTLDYSDLSGVTNPPAPVPEPSTLLLLGGGLAGLFVARMRRKARK
ncbi:PEP-CTERM sorting domain-containing protein [Geoalkalibacter halelectricus]|uniref:PEP-CTERM sorting domain-containing protein n=1 Tax=Geoalkalibacter halelectricus TaxID=2847045 RepID=A0ABY5ZIY6_9BACT|nr:PEP-CTERM sorting domain-containing protein [Geoalkalibacter halelectricus]MDO3377919.1 PEP-CTERM sorting domain-containing protein [Geoalkalibacter halelectricus]UWZ77900.1 PEP-CTERM sorting domain-containing protein [Geoalkalibacter halelectricus]